MNLALPLLVFVALMPEYFVLMRLQNMILNARVFRRAINFGIRNRHFTHIVMCLNIDWFFPLPHVCGIIPLWETGPLMCPFN